MSIIKCRVCGNSFLQKHINHSNCSIECKRKFDSQKSSKKPKHKECEFCGIEFNPYTSLDKFCSYVCRVNNVKSTRSRNWAQEKCDRIKGKNNPAYRNGNYCISNKKTAIGERKFIKNGKDIRQSMIDSNGYIYCQNCNTSKSAKFECHHLVFRSEKPLHDNLHDTENLILLCITCHNKFHKHKSIRNSIVVSRNLSVKFGNDILSK